MEKCEQCEKNSVKYKIIQYTDLVNSHTDYYVCENCRDNLFDTLNDEFGFSITGYSGDIPEKKIETNEIEELKPITI